MKMDNVDLIDIKHGDLKTLSSQQLLLTHS